MSHQVNENFAFLDESQIDNWKMNGEWPIYKFNFNGSPRPRIKQLSYLNDCYMYVEKKDHFLLYMIDSNVDKKTTPSSIAQVRHIDIGFFCLISSTNSAHALSEILSFTNFYLTERLSVPVFVARPFVDFLPLMFELMKKMLPGVEFYVIESAQVYKVGKLWLRRNEHFCYLTNWTSIPYKVDNNCIEFSNIENTINNYSISCEKLRSLLNRMEGEGLLAPLNRPKVLWIKERNPQVTTPNRAVFFSDAAKKRAIYLGWYIVDVSNFKSIQEYISTLWNASCLVLSYGGPACTNRFFVKPTSKVVVLANKSYAWEYNYPNNMGDYWHIRHSHLYPVRSQKFLLDSPDVIEPEDIDHLDAHF